MTHHRELSIIINRPVEEVFDVATCLESCVNWQGSVINAQKLTQGPTAVGSSFHHQYKFMGIRGETHPKVILYEPPHRFGFENDGDSLHFKAFFTFEPVEGGTRFTINIESEDSPGVVKNMAVSLVRGAVKRQFESDLHALKDMMENEVKVKIS